MSIRKLLGIGVLLLLLAGCSSDDDDIDVNDNKNILGYWECTTENTFRKGGLVFVSDGEVKYWQYSIIDSANKGEYMEEHWGYFYLDDEGTLEIRFGLKGSAPIPDEMYYKITSLTKDRLVIRSWGGFAGTPFEKGFDTVYKKMSYMPYN